MLSKIKQSKPGHLITLLNEMRSVAGHALEHQRRSLLNETTTELQRHQRERHEHLQDQQQGVRRHSSEGQQEVQIQQLRVEKKLKIRDMNCLSLAEGSLKRICIRHADLVRLEVLQKFSTCDTSVHGRNIGKRNACMSKRDSISSSENCANSSVKRNAESL